MLGMKIFLRLLCWFWGQFPKNSCMSSFVRGILIYTQIVLILLDLDFDLGFVSSRINKTEFL